MMKLIKNPELAVGAKRKTMDCHHYSLPCSDCQDLTPISRIIQRILTELLVLKRYSPKSSSLGGVGRAGHE